MLVTLPSPLKHCISR